MIAVVKHNYPSPYYGSLATDIVICCQFVLGVRILSTPFSEIVQFYVG